MLEKHANKDNLFSVIMYTQSAGCISTTHRRSAAQWLGGSGFISLRRLSGGNNGTRRFLHSGKQADFQLN
jgi:hypothetical protein